MSTLSSIQETLTGLSSANTLEQSSKASTIVPLLRRLQLHLQKVNDVGDIDLNEVVKSLCRLLQYGIRKSQYWERTWRASRSSESEISDGPDDVFFQGAKGMKGSEKVRLLALTCFQVLIKHNSKLLHQYWHKLLPDVDVNLASPGFALEDNITLAHLLLNDPCTRIRHAAAITLSTLLEGPSQRAYLAIAEYKASDNKPAIPLKGFISLSETIGRCAVGIHQAVFTSLEKEREIVVTCATLRLLWTLLIGSPYLKLPHTLLTSALSTLDTVLQRSTAQSTFWQGLASARGSTEDASHLNSVLSGCLTCGAALCGSKPPVTYLEEFLLSSQRANRFLQTVIDVASRQECTAARLEALMVVRGMAQNYPAVKPVHELFSLAVRSIEFCIQSESNSDISVLEKIAQQSVLLAGDCLSHISDLAAWKAFMSLVTEWGLCHERPMIRAASSVSLTAMAHHEVIGQLNKGLLEFVLYESSRLMTVDVSSPVRAASCKLLACLFPYLVQERCSYIDICHVTCALQCANQDCVLAVRIQAAGALAMCADSLQSYIIREYQGDTVKICKDRYFASVLQFLRIANATALEVENDRVKPSALQALGIFFSLALYIDQESFQSEDVDYSRTVDAICSCLGSKTAKVQWASCGASENILKSISRLEDKDYKVNVRRIVEKLQQLVGNSDNARSRLLAKDALTNAGILESLDVGEC